MPVARELVLDYIVERKRMDDLCGSIIDGRFREQKVGLFFTLSDEKSIDQCISLCGFLSRKMLTC